MKTKQSIILYAILGIASLSIAYITATAAKLSMTMPENTTQGVLMLVFASTVVMGILFFVPVATGLVLLNNEKK